MTLPQSYANSTWKGKTEQTWVHQKEPLSKATEKFVETYRCWLERYYWRGCLDTRETNASNSRQDVLRTSRFLREVVSSAEFIRRSLSINFLSFYIDHVQLTERSRCPFLCPGRGGAGGFLLFREAQPPPSFLELGLRNFKRISRLLALSQQCEKVIQLEWITKNPEPSQKAWRGVAVLVLILLLFLKPPFTAIDVWTGRHVKRKFTTANILCSSGQKGQRLVRCSLQKGKVDREHGSWWIIR